MDQARLFDETVGGSLRSFLAWAELQAEDDRRSGGVGPPDPDDDAVRVMTIHGSKGLEFPVVILAGLERDVAPGARGPDRAVDRRRDPGAARWRAAAFARVRRHQQTRTRARRARGAPPPVRRDDEGAGPPHRVPASQAQGIHVRHADRGRAAVRDLPGRARADASPPHRGIDTRAPDDDDSEESAADEDARIETLAKVIAGFGLADDELEKQRAARSAADDEVAAWRAAVEVIHGDADREPGLDPARSGDDGHRGIRARGGGQRPAPRRRTPECGRARSGIARRDRSAVA